MDGKIYNNCTYIIMHVTAFMFNLCSYLTAGSPIYVRTASWGDNQTQSIELGCDIDIPEEIGPGHLIVMLSLNRSTTNVDVSIALQGPVVQNVNSNVLYAIMQQILPKKM